MKKVTDFLINNAEDSYRDFSSKSAPSVSKENIYGVRVPKIRAFLKELTQDEKK